VLHNPTLVPERILSFGPQGSGKTTAYLEIAKFLKLSGSDAVVYIGDTDFSIPRMLTDKFAGLGNLQLMPMYTWPEYESFQATVMKARPQDWICIDFIGSAWQAVQDHFTAEVFNKRIGDYFLSIRKQLASDEKSLGAFEGWTDWQVINALYRQWVTPLLFQTHANIYATAKSDQLSSDRKPTEDATTRQLFAGYNVKPVGQKDLPFQFHTLLLTGRDARGNFTLNTIKDREREELRGALVTNFVTDYLVKIGGWKLA
jgi:hypothetical protein